MQVQSISNSDNDFMVTIRHKEARSLRAEQKLRFELARAQRISKAKDCFWISLAAISVFWILARALL